MYKPNYKITPIITKYIGISNSANNVGGIIWCLDTWNSLPKDVQEIIRQENANLEDRVLADIEADEREAYDIMKAAGMEVYSCTPAEIAEWRKLAEPIWNEWLQRTGPIGEEALEIMLRYATQ